MDDLAERLTEFSLRAIRACAGNSLGRRARRSCVADARTMTALAVTAAGLVSVIAAVSPQ